jgi:hypothetical protein
VTITESGTVVYYSLRRNRLDDASADIKRFLIGRRRPRPGGQRVAVVSRGPFSGLTVR